MPDLVALGWRHAEATLAGARSELTLVTHWFETGDDDSVNADEHFGSNERTLRFLGVALPTLIDQLAATSAVVSLPWSIEADATLTVVALSAGADAVVQTRALTRLGAGAGPPFWQLGPDPVDSPAQLAAVAAGLSL